MGSPVLSLKKKLKKLEYIPTLEEMLFPDTQNSKSEDSAWRDMIAITRALIAYGCIAPQSTVKKEYSDIDLENELFDSHDNNDILGALLFEETNKELLEQIDEQRNRVISAVSWRVT